MSTNSTGEIETVVSGKNWTRLIYLNLIVGLIDLLSAVIIYFSSNRLVFNLTNTFLRLSPESNSVAPVVSRAFSVDIPVLISVFIGLAGLAHLLVISPLLVKKYKHNLEHNTNVFRWVEYSFTSTLMIVIVSILAGIFDLGTIAMIAGLNVIMILCGLGMELDNVSSSLRLKWFIYLIGCLAAIVPWSLILINVYVSFSSPQNPTPAYMLWAVVSLFLLFNTFTVNMLMMLVRKGPWKDYLFGETVFVLLSCLAKTALAWQLYLGINMK
ncbi:MAG: heliorhodopsin HeR [Patescibacteria group bacterium]